MQHQRTHFRRSEQERERQRWRTSWLQSKESAKQHEVRERAQASGYRMVDDQLPLRRVVSVGGVRNNNKAEWMRAGPLKEKGEKRAEHEPKKSNKHTHKTPPTNEKHPK